MQNSGPLKVDRIILGIDPGTNHLGYGLIRISSGKPELLDTGVLSLDASLDQPVKLGRIFHFITGLIQKHLPDEMAIEGPFYGKNVQSMLKLGRAQGVSIAAAVSMQVPVFEYAPKRIKQSITGNGNASKDQMQGMIGKLLHGDPSAELNAMRSDASDAIGVALCHYFQRNSLKGPSNAKDSWAAFIKQNPERLKPKP